jgi:pyruvyl transferase EpsI
MKTYKEFHESAKYRKVVCFGAGRNAAKVLNDPRIDSLKDQIVFFIDSDADMQKRDIIHGNSAYEVFPPDKLREVPDCVVLITPNAGIEEIEGQVRDFTRGSAKCFSWARMHAIEIINKRFCAKKDDKPHFILMNTPEYSNLGDHAVAMAERVFLRKQFQNDIIEVDGRLCRFGMEALAQHINDSDILFITGGGNLGSLWDHTSGNISSVIEMFPNNNIVIFPQSMHYGSSKAEQDELTNAKSLFNNHKRLLICARDSESYHKMNEYFPQCSIILTPDIALLLDWPLENARSGVGICFREDKEISLTACDKDKAVEAAHDINDDVRFTSTLHPDANADSSVNGEMMVVAKLYEFCSYKCIITDRLHGMVFSVITGTPCIVFDNSYGKNRALYETWLKNIPFVYFVDNLDINNLKSLIANALCIESTQRGLENTFRHFLPLVEYIASLKGVAKRER